MARNMATIRTIDEIHEIPGRDRIVVYVFGGWTVIGQKFTPEGKEVQPEDKVVFFEIDTILNKEHPAFQAVFDQRGGKTMNVENIVPLFEDDGTPVLDNETGEQATVNRPVPLTGHVLKTQKMFGIYSQGMTAPLSEFGLTGNESQEEVDKVFVDGLLAIKYEMDPLLIQSKSQPSNTIGEFPSGILKTDSQRVQNISQKNWITLKNEEEWVATEKIDGASTTFFKQQDGDHYTDEEGVEDKTTQVAGRRWWVEKNQDYQAIIDNLGLDDLLEDGEFIQGELAGPSIQSNRLQLKGRRLFIFKVHGNTPERTEFLKSALKDHMAPVLDLEFPSTVKGAVDQVDGLRSAVNPDVQAEGVVWWNKSGKGYHFTGGRPNFKAINNKWLAKNDK